MAPVYSGGYHRHARSHGYVFRRHLVPRTLNPYTLHPSLATRIARISMQTIANVSPSSLSPSTPPLTSPSTTGRMAHQTLGPLRLLRHSNFLPGHSRRVSRNGPNRTSHTPPTRLIRDQRRLVPLPLAFSCRLLAQIQILPELDGARPSPEPGSEE